MSGLASGTNAGTYADALSGATGSGLSNYTISYTNGSLAIGKATLTLTGASQGVTYNGAAQTNSGATLSGVQGADSFAITGYASGTNAGTYTDSLGISANGGTLLSNYTLAAPTQGTLTIGKAALTAAVNNASQTYNGIAWNGGSGVSFSGLVGGDTSSVLGGALIWGGSAQGAISPGTYGLTASGLTSANYAITYSPGLLTITAAPVDTAAWPSVYVPPLEAVWAHAGGGKIDLGDSPVWVTYSCTASGAPSVDTSSTNKTRQNCGSAQ